jgi:hypothetical protein
MAPRKVKVEEAVDTPQPFNLDAYGEPTGDPITIRGRVYYFASDDDLSVDDRENLRRFSLRLREIESWEPDDDTGLMTDEQEEQITSMQVKMCHIATPTVPLDIITELAPIQRQKLLDLFFTKQVVNLRWIDRTVLNWQMNRMAPTPIRDTFGASTLTPIGGNSAQSESATSDASPDSEASSAVDTTSGDALTA